MNRNQSQPISPGINLHYNRSSAGNSPQFDSKRHDDDKHKGRNRPPLFLKKEEKKEGKNWEKIEEGNRQLTAKKAD